MQRLMTIKKDFCRVVLKCVSEKIYVGWTSCISWGLAQVWNNGSFPQCMHSEVGSQIITSTWLDTMNETGRGCDIGGGTVEGVW